MLQLSQVPDYRNTVSSFSLKWPKKTFLESCGGRASGRGGLCMLENIEGES